MTEESVMEVGRVVRSKAGRDKGGIYLVIKVIDEDYVLIANGANRSIDKPKKKKVKHLQPRPDTIFYLKEKLLSGERVLDAELRKSLKSLGYDLKGG